MKSNGVKFFICFIVATVIFICMLIAESFIYKNYEQVEVFTVNQFIHKGTIITKDNIRTYFTKENLPKNNIPKNTVTDIYSLTDKVAQVNMDAKQVVTEHNFIKRNKAAESIKDPVDISIKVSDISYATAGTLREGDFVDILISNNKESHTILSNICLNKVFTDSGKQIPAGQAIEENNLGMQVLVTIDSKDLPLITTLLEKANSDNYKVIITRHSNYPKK